MPRSPWLQVRIDLDRVRRNVRAISSRVPVIAVVKADAYGLGCVRVASAIADLVAGFCVFSLEEALAADLWKLTNKPILALAQPHPDRLADYLAAHVNPAVWTLEQATALRQAQPALCVDTGMQRFSCPPEQLDAVLAAGGCTQAFTHALNLEQVERFRALTAGRKLRLHAAGSALLAHPQAQFDAVRPGLALYHEAVEVHTRLIDARDSRGPVGYHGLQLTRHGIIPAGYAQGLRPGPCLVAGQLRTIAEVGMQSSYVDLAPEHRTGDPVTLLGPGLDAPTVATAWGTSPHEVLVRLTSSAST